MNYVECKCKKCSTVFDADVPNDVDNALAGEPYFYPDAGVAKHCGFYICPCGYINTADEVFGGSGDVRAHKALGVWTKEENKMNTLEEEFRKLATDHQAEIKAKVREASAALDEAVNLSEKYGIPFDSEISFLSQSYRPKSFFDKFSDLDSDIVSRLTGSYPGEYGDYPGWEHSQVC